MDLRERRRIETSKLIQRKALELVRDHGVASVTVDAICQAAGVSARTFFNYFPYKEAVLVVPGPPLPKDAVDIFLASTGDLLDDLVALLLAQAAAIQHDRWIARVVREIMTEAPRVAPLQMGEFQKLDRTLAALIAQRKSRPAADSGCLALASAMIAASRVAVDSWLTEDNFNLFAATELGLTGMVELLRTGSERSDGDYHFV